MNDQIFIQTTENKLVVTEQNNELVIQEQGANRIELQSIGAQGPVGQGVPNGGTYGQVLVKNSSTNYDASWSDGVLITTVRNNTGATVTAGTLVYLNGMLGNRPTIAKALANSDATSARTYGMVAQDIANNSDGPVVHAGQAKNLNTFGVPEGVTLYLSPTVPGGYTATKPSAPDHMVYIGICTRAHPTLGTIEVTITNGFELEELHNVAISSPTNKQALTYNSSTQLWNNYSLTAADIGAEPALGFTPENVANKSTNTALGTSNTLYPTQNAVKTYVDSAVSGGVPDATSTVKGKLKLAGDLGGTADLPTVPGLAGKQATLVSGTNIKTINGNSILGSGDLTTDEIALVYALMFG